MTILFQSNGSEEEKQKKNILVNDVGEIINIFFVKRKKTFDNEFPFDSYVLKKTKFISTFSIVTFSCSVIVNGNESRPCNY